MMNTKQQKAQDKYLSDLLGHQFEQGYHARGAVPSTNSTQGPKVREVEVQLSSRKASLEAN